MDDLSAMLSQVLSDPQSMQQIQSVAASLGLTGDDGSGQAALPPAQEAQPSSGDSGGLDLSALSSLLGGQTSPQEQQQASSAGPDLSALSSILGGLGGGQQAPSPAPAGGNVDMNALSSMLGGLMGGASPQPQAAAATPDLSALSGILGGIAGKGQAQSGPDLSALTALLGGGQGQAAGTGVPGLPFDINTLLKLQKAMSSVAENRANVDLLLALKPRLKEKRAQKVDDAIKVMQLIQFLPLIKESGLFGDTAGGIGGIVSGLGDGIGGVLGNLLGGNGRR